MRPCMKVVSRICCECNALCVGRAVQDAGYPYTWLRPVSSNPSPAMLRATLVSSRLILKVTAHATRRENTMPFTSRNNDRASARFEMRLTAAERAQLREEADLAGLSTSELVRKRTFGKTIHAATDLMMIRELRRLGGLQKYAMNKFAQHVEVVDECIATICAIHAAIERVANHDR